MSILTRLEPPQYTARNVAETTKGFDGGSGALLLSGEMRTLSTVILAIQQRPLIFPPAFVSLTCKPLARLTAAELSTKLSLSIKGRFAANLAGRARAFQSIVAGGMDLAKAAGLAGLMEMEGS